RSTMLGFGSFLWFLLTCSTVQAGSERPTQPPSFLNDVVPILTRLGCNQGACHGKGTGQNGFRLSLRGYAPDWDYLSLTREFSSRRINTAVPEESLLLQKPLGLVPHGGGKLFQAGTRAHRVLLAWLRAGAPGPDDKDPGVTRVEISPDHRVLRLGQEQQLVMRAQYSDGQIRDVTWLARFDSNDPGMTGVDANGLVRVLRPGETAIRAGFAGQVAVAIITSPYPQSANPEVWTERRNFIDEHIANKLASLGIEPSGL